ncbi:MAG: GTPase [Candidatus Diapherotrites archaeon]
MKRAGVMRAESAEIFDAEKRAALAGRLAKQGKNILIFGMPNSGKSTLVKAICSADARFRSTGHEELLTERDMGLVRRGKSRGFWAVGHQFPGQGEGIADAELARFAEKTLRLNLEKWLILRIMRNRKVFI